MSEDRDANGKHRELTYAIIGAAQKVHRTLGPGFPENVCHRALTHELTTLKIAFESEKQIDVLYEGAHCGQVRLDLLVDERVVVELKALPDLDAEHLAQALSYLKATGLDLALLVNFGQRSLQVERVAL